MRCIFLALLLGLSGCDGDATASGPANLTEYLRRLSAVTGVALPPPPPDLDTLDVPRDQIPDLAGSSKIDLLDFLSLSGCELQINLARRNTQMGRIASPSQRLLLDLEFMALAPSCALLLRERGNNELADRLIQVSGERQDWMVQSISQAILMGPEWQQFWRLPQALGHYPDDTSSLMITALNRLVSAADSWLGGDWVASNREFELLLSDLRAGDGGALLLAYHRVAQDLGRANAMLAETEDTSPLCPYGKPTERSKTLERVVSRFFVGNVQPWLVALRQRKEMLLGPIRELETLLSDTQHPSYHGWKSRRDILLDQQPLLIRAHIEHIQHALAECNRAS